MTTPRSPAPGGYAGYGYPIAVPPPLAPGGQPGRDDVPDRADHRQADHEISIIPIQPDQKRTRRHAAKRFLIANVAVAFIPVFNWVDGRWELWEKPYRQCLHDKFATTVVIK